MGPPVRFRYNAKARAGKAGNSSHKRRKSSSRGAESSVVETTTKNDNADISIDQSMNNPELAAESDADVEGMDEDQVQADMILPLSTQQKDEQAREKERMKAEILESLQGKASNKKRKRIESYINRQLNKERKKELILKISASQLNAPAVEAMRASSSLGSKQFKDNAHKLAVMEDRTVRRKLKTAKVIDSDCSSSEGDEKSHLSKNKPQVISQPSPSESSVIQENNQEIIANPKQPIKPPAIPIVGSALASTSKLPPTVGSALLSSKSDPAQETHGGVIPEKKRSHGFKSWASVQLAAEQPSSTPTSEQSSDPQVLAGGSMQTTPHDFIYRDKIEQKGSGPLGESLIYNQESLQMLPTVRKLRHAKLQRPPGIDQSRMELPAVAMEQEIVESILLNPVTVIAGETGSGKTTQVPQFLFERGFGVAGSDTPGMIGITQPRRVAAVSTAARVAYEMGLSSSRVSHQVRFDASISSETSIKFMTDGILLRELANDFLLSRYSVIIIDEAHERSINTDILIGVLSRVSRLRFNMFKDDKTKVKPLRLVIMSATLRVTDFSENKSLFDQPPPVLEIKSRQHPVSIHFSSKTKPNYTEEASQKILKIHRRLPDGGILVFLAGQDDIKEVCKQLESFNSDLKKVFDKQLKVNERHKKNQISDHAFSSEIEGISLGSNTDFIPDSELNAELSEDDENDQDGLDDFLELSESDYQPLYVLPLYSMLPSEQQMRVFEEPPPGHRLVVVATNVAETSLTIPNIKYVVDSGRVKERHYDLDSGIQTFKVSWISKASASQRAGRSGRTGPGHCYRLYSSAIFNDYFEEFAVPEILRMPIDGVVLQMKAMNINTVINFPFPTAPAREGLKKAELTLQRLGCLDNLSNITPLGKTVSMFPVPPRQAKMLVFGQQHDCLTYVIAIVAAITVGDPFVHSSHMDGDDKSETSNKSTRLYRSQNKFTSLGAGTSDLFKMLSAIGAHEHARDHRQFCEENFVRLKAMVEITKLREQIGTIASISLGLEQNLSSTKILPPSDQQLKFLRQLITAAYIDQVAIRKDLIDCNVPSQAQMISTRNIAYSSTSFEGDIFIHPSSALFHLKPPEYVVYQEVVQTSRIWMKGITKLHPNWLSTLGRSMCTFSRPLEVPLPDAGKIKKDEDLRDCFLIPRFGPGIGWELPPIKASQKRVGSRWETILPT